MTVILRGKTRIYAYLLYALAAISLVGSAVHGGVAELLWAVPIAAVLAAFGWVVFHNPRLEVGPGGLRVVNIIREHLIPWSDLALAENRWGLYLYNRADRKISVWGVPSNVGLFNNSWRDRKKAYEDPDIVWEDSGTLSRTVSTGFAADLIMIRHGNITRNAQLRASLKPAQYWPDQTVTKFQPLPVIVLGVALAGAGLAIAGTR
ncbi:hypothetical protein HMPREF3167_05105 [Trueperella sp. HMSC08B05]|uniref:PH domain-containing protein n=1 Tax=Trueperella bernardiae TaxID=59561 RepID=A0AAW6ZEU7_9ACTO|nr:MULTISPECIES: PH domain-containing protein [Trueperella]MDK8602491.1 PH domain-containing protein [Trueperella bernardiae]OFS74524.1 hypothetical protein HMPREF3167_05105 [Trueperella sp. HMSC08B05]PKZ88853.1 hypothetical protein CYK24_05790 [Trueperella bernardiae]